MAGERTLPGIGLSAFWTLGSNGYKDQMDSNLRKLSALVQPFVLSSVATEPVSPAVGAIHRMTGGPNAAALALWDDGAWVYIGPTEGFVVYDRTAGKFLMFDGAAWVDMIPSAGSAAYDLRSGFLSSPAGAAVVDTVHFVRAVTFPANFAGSLGSVSGVPTGAYTLTVKSNGTTIGAVTVSTGGVVSFSTSGGTTKTVAAGAKVTLESQASADLTISGLSFTLMGAL